MIPKALLDRKQWLAWRLEKDAKHPEKKKLLKVPYYVDGGRRVGAQGDEKDRRRLAVYDAALKSAPAAGLEVGNGGIGFAFLKGDGLIGIDLDNVTDGDGVIAEGAVEIIKRCASFTEYSPSGKGVHIYVAGESRTNKFDGIGVELFCGSQFFTVTGKHYVGTPDEVREISAETLTWLHAMIDGAKEAAKKSKASPRPSSPAKPAPSTKRSGDDFARVNDAAMQNLHAWVSQLLPAARAYHDGYRVSSSDLGRDLEEDLSILPSGIVDWGLNDQPGEARNGRRTPIDLVMEHGHKKAAEALHWLADRLGINIDQPRTPRRSTTSGAPDGPPGDEPPADDGHGPDGDQRPVIRWVQDRLPQVVDEAEDALIKSGLRIYQRAGFLVRVVRRDTPSVRHYKRRQPGALGILTVDEPYLIESLTRAARWQKWNAKARNPDDPEGPAGWWVPCMAPERVASTYLARRGHWQLPRLWSAISCPTLRPDGTVLQEPGYDPGMQSWYDPCGIKFPEIPESPTHEDAARALEVLREAFKSFPFEAKSDEAVALALALTALVRRSLPSAPMGGITAPIMGSGKTLLADCIAILATGVSAPAMKYADTDEEATKTMLAVLAEGDQVLLIDNVERPLEGDTLCVVLTSEAYRQRVLGRTEMMSVPTTTLFLATGNQLVMAGDLRTRALLCRIDPKSEHPEQRQFEGEKREWMTQHRPELVAAGLTIMRAFIATEQDPLDHCKAWGRFERWSDMVRAPLIWLGCDDPCASLADLAKEDPERIELLRVISAWEALFGDEGYTAREAIEKTQPSRDGYGPGLSATEEALHQVLREICKDRDGSLNAKRLGHWLRTHADRITEGKRLARAGERDHTLLWKVEKVGPAPNSGGSK
jgi:hypothetical protein